MNSGRRISDIALGAPRVFRRFTFSSLESYPVMLSAFALAAFTLGLELRTELGIIPETFR
jgi:hypothetical protein